jgi:hypothetical protein
MEDPALCVISDSPPRTHRHRGARGSQSQCLVLDPRIRIELEYTDNAASPITHAGTCAGAVG